MTERKYQNLIIGVWIYNKNKKTKLKSKKVLNERVGEFICLLVEWYVQVETD